MGGFAVGWCGYGRVSGRGTRPLRHHRRVVRMREGFETGDPSPTASPEGGADAGRFRDGRPVPYGITGGWCGYGKVSGRETRPLRHHRRVMRIQEGFGTGDPSPTAPPEGGADTGGFRDGRPVPYEKTGSWADSGGFRDGRPVPYERTERLGGFAGGWCGCGRVSGNATENPSSTGGRENDRRYVFRLAHDSEEPIRKDYDRYIAKPHRNPVGCGLRDHNRSVERVWIPVCLLERCTALSPDIYTSRLYYPR